MDAAPRIALPSLALKYSPEPAHFAQRLKMYIHEVYGEQPEAYRSELHQLEGLRAMAAHPSPDAAGLAVLYRYFCQLRALQTRFPMGKGQPAAVQFTWRDVYANISNTTADIKFEMAAILYNIAAVHTQLGSNQIRSTSEGLKSACTHYQNAAWALGQLKDDQYMQPSGVDLAPEVIKVLQELCFACAQECILEKSIRDTRKPSVVGSVAMQVINFYRNASTHLSAQVGSITAFEIMGSKLGSFIQRYVNFKLAYTSCIVYLHQGMNAEEQQKMGERVAYYQLAVDKLAEARKFVKYIEPVEVTQEALNFTNDIVEGKRKAAKNENEFIYHEEVPDKDLLLELKPVTLVKPLPINFNDPEISGTDLFARLVPISAHESSSLYSEEKAKLLRQMVAAAEKKDAELTEFMSSLQLDLLEATDTKDSIPQEVVDRCAAMNADSEIIQTLVDSMNSLAEIISDVEHSLDEIKGLIQEEVAQEKEYQKVMGPRPPSIVQTELSREANKYCEAHGKTSESNKVLHKAMKLHLSNLRLLASPLEVLQEKIPTVDKIEGLDMETMAELKRITGKVREMQTQRAALIQQLRDALNADDITATLLARSGEDPADLFQQQLEKHKPQEKIIEQNLAAQENIINRLTAVYASYGESRKLLTDVVRRRDALINALITSYDTRGELLAKSQKGLEFYRKLTSNINHLLARLRSTCQVQREERQQHLAKHAAKSNATAAPVKSTENVAAALPESNAPKLKDYLPYMKNRSSTRNAANVQPEKMHSDQIYPEAVYPTSARPAPLGSEATADVPQTGYTDGYAAASSQATAQNVYPPQYNYVETSYGASYPVYPSNSQISMPYDYQQTDKNIYTQAMDTNIDYSTYGTNYTPSQYPTQSTSEVQHYYTPYYTGSQDSNTNVTNSESTSQYPTDNVQSNINTNTTPYTYAAQTPYRQQYPVSSEVPPFAVPNYASDVPSSNPQAEMDTNFSQMQISGTNPAGNVNSSHPADISYSQTYFSAYYLQNSAPNVATYSRPTQPPLTNMSASQPQVDYGSLNYPYNADSTPAYRAPVHEDPAGPTHVPYYDNSNELRQNISQTAVSNATSYIECPPAIAHSSYPGSDVRYGTDFSNPATSNLPVLDQPIKSHVTGQALSDGSSMQQIHQQYSGTPEGNTQFDGTGRYVQTSAVHQNSIAASNIPGTYPEQVPAVGSDYSHSSYQNHPGYYFNPNTSVYEYNYGYQSSTVDYNAVQPVGQSHDENQPRIPQNIYTNAGTHETVQSPSAKTEQPTFPSNDSGDQSYYNTPYGYQSNTNATQINTNATVDNGGNSSEQANTNYSAEANHSTYMSSGTSRNSISTYSNQERPKASTTPEADPPSIPLESKPQKSESPKSTEKSTVDLLSGLDFSVEYKPLLPEIKVPPISEHVIRKPAPKHTVQQTMDQLIEKDYKSEETIERPAKKDLFSDPNLVNKFTQEVKILQKLVDGLTNKMQSGITVLDNKWKVLHDAQAKENIGRSKSAAMEFSGSNVVTEVVPYDDSRLTLKVNPEVYINASYYKQLASWCIPLVISNLPEVREHNTFWTAVLENKVACIVCLLSEMELQGKCYWPTAKGQSLELDNELKVTLDDAITTVHWTERRMTLVRKKITHSLVHYQINVFPTKVVSGPLVLLVDKVLSVTYSGKMSNQLCPAWVHCERGSGRSALVALLTLLVCQVRAGQVNLCEMLDTGCRNLYKGRTNVLEDIKFLADAYRAALFYVQGVLCSGTSNFNGEAVCVPSSAAVQAPPLSAAPKEKAPKFSKESFEEMKQAAGLKTGDMKDPLSFLDPLWSLKKK